MSVLVRYSSVQLLPVVLLPLLSVGFFAKVKGSAADKHYHEIGIQNEIDNNDFYIIEIYFNCQ